MATTVAAVPSSAPPVRLRGEKRHARGSSPALFPFRLASAQTWTTDSFGIVVLSSIPAVPKEPQTTMAPVPGPFAPTTPPTVPSAPVQPPRPSAAPQSGPPIPYATEGPIWRSRYGQPPPSGKNMPPNEMIRSQVPLPNTPVRGKTYVPSFSIKGFV